MSNLKQEVLDKINATDDENLLQHIKTEIEYFKEEGLNDITDGLAPEALQELGTLANEPDEYETQTMKEFDKATQRWNTK